MKIANMDRRKYLQQLSAGSIAPVLSNKLAHASQPNRKTRVWQESEASIDAGGIEAKLEVSRNVISNDETSTIKLEIKNVRSEKVSLEYNVPNLVNRIQGTRKKGNVQAFVIGVANTWEPSGDRPFEATSNMLTNNDSPDRIETINLLPGGTYNMKYELWANPGNNAYFPPGIYEFTRDYNINNDNKKLRFELGIGK